MELLWLITSAWSVTSGPLLVGGVHNSTSCPQECLCHLSWPKQKIRELILSESIKSHHVAGPSSSFLLEGGGAFNFSPGARGFGSEKQTVTIDENVNKKQLWKITEIFGASCYHGLIQPTLTDTSICQFLFLSGKPLCSEIFAWVLTCTFYI